MGRVIDLDKENQRRMRGENNGIEPKFQVKRNGNLKQ
jgi:hypothetical protein